MDDQQQDLQAEMACSLSKEGNSLYRISQLMEDEPKNVLSSIARKTELDMHTVDIIFDIMEEVLPFKHMPPSIPLKALKLFVPPQTELLGDYTKAEVRRCFGDGLPVPKIVACLGVTKTEVLEVLKDELPLVTEGQPSTTTEQSVGMTRRDEANERIEFQQTTVEGPPQYFYSYTSHSTSLFRTTLSTGRTMEERVRNHRFKAGSVWCEVPGGDICFTGGLDVYDNSVNEAVRVSGNSLEVTQMAGMLRGRAYHGSVYDDNYLYAIGSTALVGECERLVVSEDRWEALPRLPRGLVNLSVIVMKKTQCLYALGGRCSRALDLIQRLSLRRLEWDTQSLRLPSSAFGIACFKQDESKVWFVEYGELYCLNAENECAITLIKEVGRIQSFFGPSYYYRGYLYCSNSGGAAYRTEIGQL